eukprot:gene4753-biopygen4673
MASASFMLQTCLYFSMSARSKYWNLSCRSLYCSVIRRYDSVRTLFSCLKRLSVSEYFVISPDSTSCSRASFRLWVAIALSFSLTRSDSTCRL